MHKRKACIVQPKIHSPRKLLTACPSFDFHSYLGNGATVGARATKTTERSLKFSTTSSYLMGEKEMKTKKVLPRQKRERFAPTSVLYCPGTSQGLWNTEKEMNNQKNG
ncbi:hypothetical protein OUZ56_004389 [Daphnia magna]|uniref:Uncharacterized protein n=1 Tax=Daphnia magna TaxID=35525 RepID=A0ABQ9YQ05_9CRUS|nr:hypothetical protein OUZ56_004389 [Daphnia magna]